MEVSTQQYRLRWNNHRSNLLTVFEELLENEAFTDVTLAVENGASVKCHKMVLAACSSYFQNLFTALPCKHPIIVLKDVKHREIKAILEYMYRGEVNVAHEHLPSLLKVAEVLKVKGLVEQNGYVRRNTEEEEEGVETTSSPPPAISTSTASNALRNSSHKSVSPGPHSTENVYNYVYGKHPYVDGSHHRRQSAPESLPLHMWPISAALPLTQHQHHSTYRQSTTPQHHRSSFGYGRSYEADDEITPASCHKRKFSSMALNRDTPILRTVLGQSHADSSQTAPPTADSRDNSYGGATGPSQEIDRRSSSSIDRSYISELAQSQSHLEASMVDEDDEDHNKRSSPQSFIGDNNKPAGSVATYNSSQKPEWKRYKQYTREDMMSAIEAVKSGMSALQAARKYGVPPRTLYDKVKKMGITTTRPLKRGSNGSGACFPFGIGGNVNGSIYGNSGYYETEAADSNPIGVALDATTTTTPLSLESNYVKWRDVAADTSHHRFAEPQSPPPGYPMEKQQLETERVEEGRGEKEEKEQEQEEREEQAEEEEEEEEEENQVEDLSVPRKPALGVIVPLNTFIKEEKADAPPENLGNN